METTMGIRNLKLKYIFLWHMYKKDKKYVLRAVSYKTYNLKQ
jgi:hypothetical protein